MRTGVFSLLLLLASVVGYCAESVSLDSCRNMALRNNRQLLISEERIRQAGYREKEAKSAFLPALDFEGGYLYNEKNISLLGKDAQLLLERFLPKDMLSFDINNVFAGAVTIIQPVYWGGKIRELNKVAKLAETLAQQERDMTAQEIIYSVDIAYWQVVSLKAKELVAQQYVALLDTLSQNVNAMIQQGVATRSDALSVTVKRNEALVDLAKVKNGLTLSRMALAQLCGLPTTTHFTLCDEDSATLPYINPEQYINMNDVYRRRNDVNALKTAIEIRRHQANAERSAMLPQIAIVGAYSVSNPNVFNGFENKFDGMFSVGATIKIPIWHWGGCYNKFRAAKCETIIANLNLEDAKSKIALQVNEAAFKCDVAQKSYTTALSNCASAKENLRMAMLGYHEGIITSSQVMEAQTAWLKAQSQLIDSGIEMRLCDVYLSKALGTLPLKY